MNRYNEIQTLLKASKALLGNEKTLQETNEIRRKYNLISEQVDVVDNSTTSKIDVSKSIETDMYDDTNTRRDKKQAYRISGSIIVLHGKKQIDLELTTDEKTAFQDTMQEFTEEVSDLAEFNPLNVYRNSVEWSGRLIEFDLEFIYNIGEENGVYIKGELISMDEKFLEVVQKLKAYFEKFKSKWARILGSRKLTRKK